MARRPPLRLSPRLALALLVLIAGLAVVVALLWPPSTPPRRSPRPARVAHGPRLPLPVGRPPVAAGESPMAAGEGEGEGPGGALGGEGEEQGVEAAVRVAIVIDDLGRDLAAADRLLATGEAITFSVIPFLAHSTETAERVHAAGEVVLLHLPMEPQAYPRIQPGKGGLLVAMDEATLCRQLDDDLAAVPFAEGVNNHMGSRLTEEAAPMAVVMAELAARGLFFLDSRTTPHSVAPVAAARAGVPWLARDIFLDNDQTPEAIATQFDRLIDLALQHGHAIAIGHPHPATLEALEAALPRLRAEGIVVVPVGDLLPPPEVDLLPPAGAMWSPPSP